MICPFDEFPLRYDWSCPALWNILPTIKVLFTCCHLEFPAHRDIFHPSLCLCHSAGSLRTSAFPHEPPPPRQGLLGSLTSCAECGELKCSCSTYPPCCLLPHSHFCVTFVLVSNCRLGFLQGHTGYSSL